MYVNIKNICLTPTPSCQIVPSLNLAENKSLDFRGLFKRHFHFDSFFLYFPLLIYYSVIHLFCQTVLFYLSPVSFSVFVLSIWLALFILIVGLNCKMMMLKEIESNQNRIVPFQLNDFQNF